MDTDFAGEAAVASSLDDGSLPSPAHFDEWHDAHGVRAHWQQFFQLESPVELAGKQGDADRQIRDNGITYNVYADTQNEAWSPPELIRRMVAAGELGRKAGKGFYDYE